MLEHQAGQHKLNVQTTAINLTTVPAPSSEQYILNKVQPLGSYATNLEVY